MALEPLDHKTLAPPPGFAPRPAADPWRAALGAGEAGEAPGALFCGAAGGILEAALLLAPERPIAAATALRLATLATFETLVAAVAPETHVSLARPGSVTVNGGEAASLRSAQAPAPAGSAPAWLVLGFTVRIALGLADPGLTPHLTDLAEEGGETAPAELLESLCRHLLALIHLWQDEGGAGIDGAWAAAGALQAA